MSQPEFERRGEAFKALWEALKKIGTPYKIDLTATGIIRTPAAGKKIRILAFTWTQSTASVISALRFEAAGNLLFAIQDKGVMAMNLLGSQVEGAVDESLYGYLSAAGVMKGTVVIEET